MTVAVIVSKAIRCLESWRETAMGRDDTMMFSTKGNGRKNEANSVITKLYFLIEHNVDQTWESVGTESPLDNEHNGGNVSFEFQP